MKNTISASILIFSVVLFSEKAIGEIIPIANSVDEFSGIQGKDNWYYGFYDGDLPNPYAPDDFELMTQFGNWGTGPRWMVHEGVGWYWTAIGKEVMHPNGLITSGGRQEVEHWAARRWVSEVSGVINITGNLSMFGAGSGFNDGIAGHIFIDGIEVFTQVIDRDDLTGVNYSVNEMVTLGSVVDFVVSPRSTDGCDTTVFTAVITPEPATFLLLGLGSLALLKKQPSDI